MDAFLDWVIAKPPPIPSVWRSRATCHDYIVTDLCGCGDLVRLELYTAPIDGLPHIRQPSSVCSVRELRFAFRFVRNGDWRLS